MVGCIYMRTKWLHAPIKGFICDSGEMVGEIQVSCNSAQTDKIAILLGYWLRAWLPVVRMRVTPGS